MRDYDDRALADLIPYPKVDANKYTRGKLTLLVGSRVYPGAAILAAMASQRAGAGYTEVYAEDKVVAQVQAARASLVVRPWSSWDARCAAPSDDHHPCAYVIGCGFDAGDSAASDMVRGLLRHAQVPVLVDGGALASLSGKKMRMLCRSRHDKGLTTVVTPHRGEAVAMARALSFDAADQERFAAQLAHDLGVLVVLKGPDTCISDGVDVYRMTQGTSALAKAGTGDVLAGIVGALLAQGLEPFDACVLGTTLHARAGVLASHTYGSVSVCAEDVIEHIPRALCALAGEKMDLS